MKPEQNKIKAGFTVWSQFCKNWCQDLNIIESIIKRFLLFYFSFFKIYQSKLKSVSTTEINNTGKVSTLLSKYKFGL